ncbi:uncharacterized protein LOC136031028 [Artemia franciscana]|uniref:uncharacterized protein LOC136031028 n=1 Tax=Artemia franciscana TaxID=6661 RepID=UPI0032DBD4CD
MRDTKTTVSSDRKLNDVGAAAPLEEDEPNPPPIAATPQETSPSSDDCPEWLKKRIKCLKEICLENVLEHSELHEKVIKLTREIAELKEMNRKLQGSRIRVEIRQRLNQVPQPSAIINTTEEEQGVNDVSTASTSSSLNHGIPVPDIYELGGQMKEKQGQKKSGSEVNRQQSPKAQSPGVSVQKATHRRPPSPEAVRPSEKENQVPLTEYERQ